MPVYTIFKEARSPQKQFKYDHDEHDIVCLCPCLSFFCRQQVESFKSYRWLDSYVGLLPSKTISFSFHTSCEASIQYYVAGSGFILQSYSRSCTRVHICASLLFIHPAGFFLPKLLTDSCYYLSTSTQTRIMFSAFKFSHHAQLARDILWKLCVHSIAVLGGKLLPRVVARCISLLPFIDSFSSCQLLPTGQELLQ